MPLVHITSLTLGTPKSSSSAERVPQGTKPRAKPKHKKHSTSSKQPSVSSKEATKVGSSKAPTSSKTGHSKKRKKSSLAMDSNPIQPSVSALVDTRMHKEDQQETGGPTSLGVVSKERASPRLSNDASAVSTVEADTKNSAPSDFIPQQQVLNVQPCFKYLDSPEYDHVIIVDDTDEDDIHASTNDETKDTLVPKSSSKLNELLVKSIKIEFLNIKSAHDFSSSLPIELKDLPSKFDELTEEVKGLKKQVHSSVETSSEILSLPVQVALVQAKLKTLNALLGLLLNVTKALNKFTQVLDSASSNARDQSVPSAGQANTRPAEGENDTNQATISYVFQRKAEKNAEKDNLNKNKPQTKLTSPPIPLEDKGKKALSLEEATKESTDSDSDDKIHMTGSMVEPSKTKKLKKFDFITKDGRHIHLTKEQINHQKKLEEYAKVEPAKQEGQVRKAELVDLLGLEVSQKDELEQQKAKAKAEVASLKARTSYLDLNQLTELLVTSLKPELSKLLASHDFVRCLPIELKELPLKVTELYGEIKELKKHVIDMEIELHGDLKEIPTKLETFTSTISSLTSQLIELKNI
nr:hypothetical protein [Tanacetum cinerariifolium]